MRPSVLWTVIFACFASLLLACYAPVLFQGRQFGYRDAAHYYYPLYQRVQTEWNEGRWPLWEPEENGGMPLVGNPTAAVFYPGKVIYALFPYPWAARIYVVAHTCLAFAAMLVLLRSWGTSWTGSAIGALSYAFGAPILFQYCNIIYLVGSAWLPLGLRAADRWLRLGRRFAVLELALVLMMEILGGDLEVAYVTGLCAAGYAVALAWLRGRSSSVPVRTWPLALGAVLLVAVWCAVVLVLAAELPALRPNPKKPPARAFVWMEWVPPIVASAWGVVGLVAVDRWRRRGWKSRLGTMLTGLIGAAVVAGSLAAVQLFPVLEFSRQSIRAAGEGIHDIYPFSLEPIRLTEFFWPNISGTAFTYNRNWLLLMPPQTMHSQVWTPSLYVGGLTLIVALGAAGIRGEQPWRGWLTVIALVTLLASLGEFTSPLWWARWSPSIAKVVGPHDPLDVAPIRQDTFLRDGDGSFYWTLATILPGFKQFRYPSKLLTFTALAVAGLAGMGWDEFQAGRSRRTLRLLAGATLMSAAALVAGVVARQPITGLFSSWGGSSGSAFGPFDPPGAYLELRRALIHAAVVLSASMTVLNLCRRRPVLAGSLALVIVSADLAVANARYVLTVPQQLLEGKPRVVELIEQAEREQPTAGPFRVHRMKTWSPPTWNLHPSPDRVREFVQWERETIQPKYGLGYNISYTQTAGFAELYDYEWFFNPFLFSATDEGANALRIKPGERIVVYPRRGFDLWNTRYFVVPVYPGDWKDGDRGYASFLPQTTPVYPLPNAYTGPGGEQKRDDWILQEDFQVLRNLAEFPRAWVVHGVRWLKPIAGLAREDREGPIQEILYQNDPFWSEKSRVPYDPKVLAWLDSDVQDELARFVSGPAPSLKEPVTVTIKGPQRVELDCSLEKPGLVVLADVYYPGWKLAIDGTPSPIYRANRMMRAAAVQAGKHHLVYTYEPRSFQDGG